MEKKVAIGILLALLLTSIAVLAFNIQPAKASGTIYIRADGSIDPPTAPISTVDNVTYTFIGNINDSIVVERSNIIIDGNEYTLQGSGNENGFYSERTNNVTITRANIKGFKRGVYFSSTSHNIIFGNNITANEWFGICFGNSSNNIIANNSITNNGLGVYFWDSSNNNTVANNNITANGDDGIHLSNSLNNTIASNNIKANNQYGIWLKDSSNKNTIINNNITSNNGVGIYLSGSLSQCSNNIVGNNHIVNNKNGIFLWDSSNNSIANNDITANNLLGIEVINSINNSITNNNIANNWRGISLGYSSNNIIYHNNFINNTNQTNVYDSPNNVWDNGYPSGGNYWSDYTGVDEKSGPNQDQLGSDGIGDTPYVITSFVNNRDRYPLTSPWAPTEHELAVSIIAQAYLQVGSSTLLTATVTNTGLNDEVTVEFLLIINSTMTNSTIIPLLQAGNSYTLTYLWTPTVEGKYNVTAYAPPVPDETFMENNQQTRLVTVSPPPEVGVKAGDWIKVEYTITGWPTGQPYPEWLKVEFLTVEGTNATVQVTMHMSNGTEQNATVLVVVGGGGGEAFGLSGFVIPANLTVGDSVYITGYGNITIAGETQRTYAGASRTVVHASFSQYGNQLTYYWDKQTGVMVEASTTSGTMTGTGKATETNMWQPELFALDPIILYSLVIVTIVIVAAVAFLAIRRKKKPPEVESPQSQKPAHTHNGDNE